MNQEHAFPNPHRTDLTGMTLRDYFAAKAMQGFVSILNSEGGEPFYGVIAIESYRMADAMMEARK